MHLYEYDYDTFAIHIETDVEKRLGKGLVVDMKRTEGGPRGDHQTLEESLKKQVFVWEKQVLMMVIWNQCSFEHSEVSNYF